MEIDQEQLKLLWMISATSVGATREMLRFQFGNEAVGGVDVTLNPSVFSIIDKLYKDKYPDEYAAHMEWSRTLSDDFRHDGFEEFSSNLPKSGTLRDDVRQILEILTAVEHDND
jgi:hypothetical protein